MKKSIVKARLDSYPDFIESLADINLKFAKPYWQHDRIFVPRNYERNKALPRLSLRTIVRDGDQSIYALVLRRHFEESHLDIINSTPVLDYAEAAHILYQLGYELKYEVARHREELRLNDTVKLYVDKIDSLPECYAKLESDLDDEDDPIDAYADLKETFRVLGVYEECLLSETYGEILDSVAPLQ